MAYEVERFLARLQTRLSKKMDLVELAKLVLMAGWKGEDAITAIAVAGGESGYKLKAMNVDKRHGGRDWGLFQINEIHRPDMQRIYDPEYQVQVAYSIWERRNRRGEDGFLAWMAYRDRYLTPQRQANWEAHMVTAKAAYDEAIRQVSGGQ